MIYIFLFIVLHKSYDIGCTISKWLHIVDCLATSQRLKLQLVQQRSKYQVTKTIEIPLSPLHHCRRLWEKKPISLWASFPGWCFTEQSSEQPSTLSPFVPHLLLARNHSALILPHTQFHFFAKQMCHIHIHTHIHRGAYALSSQPKVENLDKQFIYEFGNTIRPEHFF